MIKHPERAKGPGFEPIDDIDFLPVTEFKLTNGIPVSLIEAGSQDVTRIDWVFPAGSIQAEVPLLASTVANLIFEGTETRSSSQISETLDFYGAYLNAQTYHHNSVITLFCLTRDLPVLLPLVEDIIKNATFDPIEFDIYLNKRRQEHLLESDKVKIIAARKFSQVLFGEDHPYGRKLELYHFDTLKREALIDFYKNAYTPQDCRIVVAGQPGSDLKELLGTYFGSPQWNPGPFNQNGVGAIQPMEQKFHLIEREGALQSALRIGRPLFNNQHPDFIALQVVNTILGGYFGSRLMMSVREDKGLTYGIGSSIMPFRKSGMWMIASEVKGEMRQAAIDAIFEEMKRLIKEPVSEHELGLVKNYMLGELLRNFDGPFSSADIYRSLMEFDLDFSFYAEMAKQIRSITAEKIQSLASEYLNPEDFYVVVAGK